MSESWQNITQLECLQIRYWSVHDKEAAAHRVQVNSQEYSARLENLLPDTQYSVEVRACNSAGCGPPSEMIETFTKKARESQHLHFRLVKNYLLILSWRRYIIISITITNVMQLAELNLDTVIVTHILLLFTAPSQPPKITSSVRSGSRYIITWDHVVALSNESTVTGYKVDKRLLDYSPHKPHS